MPFANLKNVCVHYDLSGPEDAPVLVLSNSLGTNFSMWDAQASAFSKHFRVLRYDTRGHGLSSVPPGPYSLEQLARDVLELLDDLGIAQVSFCGLSLGGMTGLWLARHAPNRMSKLVACSTAAKLGTPEVWNARLDAVRRDGMKAIIPGVLERWFTPAFRLSSPEAVEITRRMLENAPVEGYAACCAAVRDMDLREDLAAIHVPTLVATAKDDPVTTPADGHFLTEQIPGARYKEFPGAHLFNLESATEVTAEVLRFLNAP
jgi:3-oxoadipate enol-lactonase